MNIMTQNTIDEHGGIVEKDRLNHDQSYKWGSGTSVNSRVDKDNLPACRFGACLKRLINWTVSIRKKFPGKKIISSKIYYKSAYRRCHLNANTEIQNCNQMPEEDLENFALWLTSDDLLDPMNGMFFQSLSVICQFQSCRMLVGIQLLCVLPMST